MGDDADLAATVGRGDGGVPHGERLAAFAEAATRGAEDLPEVRARLLEAVGPEATLLAAATVGIFNGLVRTADATGIPLDDGTLRASETFRAELGLNEYAGAVSTAARAARVESADGAADAPDAFSAKARDDVRRLFSSEPSDR